MISGFGVEAQVEAQCRGMAVSSTDLGYGHSAPPERWTASPVIYPETGT